MKNKVILISIDGMRPDGLKSCGNPYVNELEKRASYSYSASSVMPSVTLPCHFSMTHAVTPERHGILTNTYVPQVRPVAGIFEKVKAAGGVCAMFYGWEPLRDIARPGSLKFASYINSYMKESTDTALTDEALHILSENEVDFAFLYMVETDEKGGHDNGWMTDEYLKRISIAIDNVKRIVARFGDEYSIIITADHGGHGRTHGSDSPEDMTIPMFFMGKEFIPGALDRAISLIDIPPTIAAILGVECDREWEGKALV